MSGFWEERFWLSVENGMVKVRIRVVRK